MKVSTIMKLVSVSLAVIIASFVVLIISNNGERDAISTQAIYKQLGLDLSGASDFLTNQARAYVQYGEKQYYDAYMEEVNVTKTRDRVVAELKSLGAPQNELDLVEKAFTYSQTLAELETLAFEAVEQGNLEAARHLMFGPEYDTGKEPIVNTMTLFQNTMAERTGKAAESAQTQARVMLILFSVLFGATALLIILSLMSIQKKMKLISKLVGYSAQIASGSTNIVIEDTSRDEVGALAESFRQMVMAIQKQAKVAEQLASGDLTVDVHLRSEEDTMGIALRKMVDSLNGLFGQINLSTHQVSTGSKQIADGAQTLAQGSAEQASAIEKLSDSIGDIAVKTKRNAGIAKEAAALSATIRGNAEKGSTQMEQMMEAVKEINDASGQINRVIKVIDDIAFQTNILALNAAVEAARAGQHGKGFAVVAEEVRNLAAESAAAAKDTGSLIENSVAKANMGLDIATETSASLSEIVDGINRSAEIITQIASSSDEQAEAITHVNTGIDQVANVVQQNSATAEESAAASEEMSGQCDMLHGLVAQFRLKDEDMSQRLLHTSAAAKSQGSRPVLSEKTAYAQSEYSGGMGKY